MDSGWRSLAFVALGILLVAAVLAPSSAQPAGTFAVNSDLELLGIGGMSGGGHVTWSLTGEQAQLLRRKIVDMFDGRASVPSGFAYAGRATSGNGDGVIQSAEAQAYTDALENELEGIRFGYSGTETWYVRIDRVDILEKGFPIERSSEGLVGSTATMTDRLEIKFIFNAYTTSADRVFALADASLAHAVHSVFDLEQVQALPDATPLALEDGWHLVTVPSDGALAMWAGNATYDADPLNGRYDNASSRATRSLHSPFVPYTDLRFATNASFSLRYTGRVADAGDLTVIQIADDAPAFSNWVNLTATDGTTAWSNTAAGTWESLTYDLISRVGRTVRLRVLASSDATGNDAPGFLVRDVRLTAPSRAEGVITEAYTDYLVGTLSFQDFGFRDGTAHLIRTPAGEILLYSATYDATAVPTDAARFRGFDAVENPQILTVALIGSAYAIAAMQNRFFRGYRRRHPERYRGGAEKIRWLHWTGRGIIILLILLYFFPSVFVFLGARVMFGGGPYWALAVGSAVGLSVATWFAYNRAGRFIPPDVGPGAGAAPSVVMAPPPPPDMAKPARSLACTECGREIEDIASAYQCRCGKVYHKPCAIELKVCMNCGRGLVVEARAEVAMRNVACSTCAQIQAVPETANAIGVVCSSCGATLQAVERGYNYLLVDLDSDRAIHWFRTLVERGIPGMVLSTSFPDKLRREFGLDTVDVYWISNTGPGPKVLDPRRLDFEIMRAVSNFIKGNRGSAVLIDGLEFLSVQNTFDRVLKFIKKVIDLASVHEATLFVPLTPESLGSDEMTLLKKEFDRVEDLVATPK